tara:strand:+ start:847 stop:1086 length:240 start_codon:yes stop_codon:yes gene_type:complete
MIDTDKIYKEWCKVRNLMFDKGVEVYDYRDLDEYISNLLAEVKRLRKALYEITKTEFFSYLKDVHPNDFLTENLEEMKE